MKSIAILLTGLLLLGCQAKAVKVNLGSRDGVIYGIGIGEKMMAGKSFTLSIAKSNARIALANQIKVSDFQFINNEFSQSFKKSLSVRVKADKKPAKQFFTGKGDAVIILKGYSSLQAAYKDELCKMHQAQVSTQDNPAKAISSLMKDAYESTAKYAAKSKSRLNISGVMYIKGQNILVSEDKTINIATKVCVADLK